MTQEERPATEKFRSIEAELRKLCMEMSKTHALSKDDAEELYAHIEDKALGYLSDNVRLSADDVLVLVREHFGSPSKVAAVLGKDSGAPSGGGLFRALGLFWPARRSTDILGTFYFPWLSENRLLFPLGVFMLLEIALYFPLIIMRNREFPGWFYGLPSLVALLAGSLFFATYWIVGKKLDAKRILVRRSPDLESEGVIVHGMTKCPGIIQSFGNQIVMTPILGDQIVLGLSDIQKVRERHFYNGAAYWGDNAAFSLNVRDRRERIGFVVPRPDGWRRLLRNA